MRVRIAARRSALARLQAYLVGDALHQAHSHLTIDYHFRESLGDQQLDAPLWQMTEKGVFTEDLRTELIAGHCDLVVHSWKDLPVEISDQTTIAATLPRADQRDLLLLRADRWAAVAESGTLNILTSSPRRTQNLNSFLPEALPAKIQTINFLPVRGNISTRVQKLWTQEADGLIVAKAALDRLLEASAPEFAETQIELRRALAQLRWMVLPLRVNPTAAAQGALAIEIKRDRADLQSLLAPINCAETMAMVNHERETLQSYGGGCHQAIGVSMLRRVYGELKLLRGLDTSGNELNESVLSPVRPRPPKLPLQELWPVTRTEADWFTREPLAVEQPETSLALWVAKADALPDHWQIPHTQIVWASGLQTWRRLAARGIWVNGSADSLGEQEAPNIEQLASQTLKWLKLTHADSLAESDVLTLATYRLTPRAEVPDLSGRRCFFWSSGSSFMHALARYPELREQMHCCGPGNTQRVLQQAGVEPHIFLDHQQWLAEMTL